MEESITITVEEREALQFETIFRNQFGVLPADLGMVTSSYSATGNGHTIVLPVIEGKIIAGWKVDGTDLIEHRITSPGTRQDDNLALLKGRLGLA